MRGATLCDSYGGWSLGVFGISRNKSVSAPPISLRKSERIEAEVIPKAGHDLTFVQAEMVNQKVVKFLESHL